MFTRDELNQIEKLKTDNPKLHYLFHKIEQENQYFISKIQHSIRNDLTLMMSSIQITETRHPEVNGFKYWKECMNSAVYIRDLLEELSDYYNSCRITCLSFNLDRLLADLARSASCTGCASHTSVLLRIEDSCPVFDGDPGKLYHALELLIKNSYEAIPEENGRILLTLSQASDFYKISVFDNGKGFPDEMKQEPWKPFSSSKKHHTGLGLCTANSIVLAHGGHMRLAYSDTCGTCLEIYLPLSRSGKYKELIEQTN